ncbi:MAG: ion channel [Pirellulales bacterium]
MSGTFEGETAFVLTVGILLVGVSLAIHACFMFLILKSQVWLKNRLLAAASGASLLLPSIMVATVWIAVSSFIQVALWAWVLQQFGRFDTFLDAFYFSGTTFTTLGTAKHVLVPPYRAFEPMEAATGMLASGLNTAVLFAILASMGRKRSGFEEFFR